MFLQFLQTPSRDGQSRHFLLGASGTKERDREREREREREKEQRGTGGDVDLWPFCAWPFPRLTSPNLHPNRSRIRDLLKIRGATSMPPVVCADRPTLIEARRFARKAPTPARGVLQKPQWLDYSLLSFSLLFPGTHQDLGVPDRQGVKSPSPKQNYSLESPPASACKMLKRLVLS